MMSPLSKPMIIDVTVKDGKWRIIDNINDERFAARWTLPGAPSEFIEYDGLVGQSAYSIYRQRRRPTARLKHLCGEQDSVWVWDFVLKVT